MNYISLLTIYNFTKSSVMWMIIIGILVMIVAISIFISIARKSWAHFGATTAITIPFLFISIMGCIYPLPGTDYTNVEKNATMTLSMEYNKMSGAFENDSLVFYKKQTSNIICKDANTCNSYFIFPFTYEYMRLDMYDIDVLMDLLKMVKKNSTITVVKDSKKLMVTKNEKEKTIKFEVDLREHYYDKEQKEKDEALDSLELSKSEELTDEVIEKAIMLLFEKSIDDFDISNGQDTIKYTIKADL